MYVHTSKRIVRRLLNAELLKTSSCPCALLDVHRQASVKAPSRRRGPRSTTQASSPSHKGTIDVAALKEKNKSSQMSSLSPGAPVSSSASPSWVQNTLHYDPRKVKDLANLFTGASAASFSPREVVATHKDDRRRPPQASKSVEEQLRQPPAPVQRADAAARADKRNALQDRRVRAPRDGSCHAEGDAQYRKSSESAHNWSSSLLGSQNPTIVQFLTELLAAQAALNPISATHGAPVATQNNAASAMPAKDREALAALLMSSRLHWHLSTSASVPLVLSGESSSAEAVHSLCLLATILESSVSAFQAAQATLTPNVAPAGTSATKVGSQRLENIAHPMSPVSAEVEEWRSSRITTYRKLLHRVTALLTAALAGCTGLSSSLTAVRMDALLSALLSLLRVLDVCGSMTETSQDASSRGRNGENEAATSLVSTGETIESAAMEQLCVEASAILARWASSESSFANTPSSLLLSSEGRHLLQSYVVSASSLRTQLFKLQGKKLAGFVVRTQAGQSALQGVVSTTFLFYIVILHVTAAVEGSAAGMFSTTSPADVSDAAPVAAQELKTEALPHERASVLTGKGRLSLMFQAELLHSLLHPQPDAPRASQASVHYRTTSTALSMSLSSLWRYGTRSRAAQMQRLRAGVTQESYRSKAASSTATLSVPSLYLSSYFLFWERHPAAAASLISCYYDLLATSSALLPSILEPVSTSATDSSWVVPYYSRLIRLGMNLQLDGSFMAAAHLGLEAAAPRSPDTPLRKVIESRLRSRYLTKSHASPLEAQTRPPAVISIKQQSNNCVGAVAAAAAVAAPTSSQPPTAAEDVHRVCDADDSATWARVMRLSGGLRAACCEVLYRAVLDITTLCVNNPSASARLSDQRPGRAAPPAVVLIKATSRLLFCMPRIEYVLGLYTDSRLTADAAMEQSRRVYAACVGVFLWLRELSPSFGSNFAQLTTATDARAASPTANVSASEWLVCGTTKANALEAAFFMTYLLHHWPSQSNASQHHQQRQPHDAPQRSINDHAEPLMRALLADGVTAPLPPSAVDSLISHATAETYVAETIFLLQHDTASLLRHLRTTDRFHHFSGEKRDKTALMEDPALQRRHVASTLSVVLAYQKQPTFVWMPLESVQEIVFELGEFPHLLTVPTQLAGDTASLMALADGAGDDEDDAATKRSDGGGLREYPKVQIGDIVCTFARAHGYLVRRLHVLSGILREYRSLLLSSSPSEFKGDARIDEPSEDVTATAAAAGRAALTTFTASNTSQTSAPSSFPASSSAAPHSFHGLLAANATHAPSDEGHRRNNYHWAHPWAMMLHEDFARLPAEMEGTMKWATGALRVLQRMELLMYDTHRQSLFFNVVKTQQHYRSLKNAHANDGPTNHMDAAPFAEAKELHSYGEPSSTPRRVVVQDVHVTRHSSRVPLGVALDGNGYVLRVQDTVAAPLPQAADEGEVEMTRSAAYRETEDVASPFALALATCQSGAVDASRVVGRRISAVDGVTVATGREVAMQVKDKTTFTLSIEC